MFLPVNISNSEEFVGEGACERMIKVDLSQASNAEITSVKKQLTSPVLDGTIDLKLSFTYAGDIAPGNLEYLDLSITHTDKNWRQKEVTYAQSKSMAPLQMEGNILTTEVFSQHDDLIMIRVSCFVM